MNEAGLGTTLGLAALCAFTLASGLVPVARFPRERIELTLSPDLLEVDGTYVYEGRTPLPLPQGLTIPFPVDAGQTAPTFVRVEQLGDSPAELPVRWILGSPVVVVAPSRGAPVTLRVRFSQRLSGARATYLLTTTGPWGAPLEEGRYVLRSRCVEEVRSSLGHAGDGEVTRRGFSPDEEWTIDFRRVEAPCPR